MAEALHPIQAVADRTGLSVHVIRVWEKRYEAVTPERTPTNRRLYSDEQIARLQLLRQLTVSGQAIGYIAKLPTERLKSMVADTTRGGIAATASDVASVAAPLLARALDAVQGLDAPKLHQALREAEVSLGSQGVLQRVIAPLAQVIGDRWRDGSLTAAQEHFATAAIRTFLSHAARPFAGDESAPRLVVGTPAGQLHELGALLAAAAAANLGWRVTYLGPSLPAAEIAGAARQNGARAVALSIVYPGDDAGLHAELMRLAELLPDTPIIAGGRAMPSYRKTLDSINALAADELPALGAILDRLRTEPAERRA